MRKGGVVCEWSYTGQSISYRPYTGRWSLVVMDMMLVHARQREEKSWRLRNRILRGGCVRCVTCHTFTSHVAPVTPRCGLAVLVGELVCASLPSARTRYQHQQQQRRWRRQQQQQQQQQHRHHHIHRSHSPPVTGTIIQLPLHETMQNPAPLPLDVRGLGLYS